MKNMMLFMMCLCCVGTLYFWFDAKTDADIILSFISLLCAIIFFAFHVIEEQREKIYKLRQQLFELMQ